MRGIKNGCWASSCGCIAQVLLQQSALIIDVIIAVMTQGPHRVWNVGVEERTKEGTRAGGGFFHSSLTLSLSLSSVNCSMANGRVKAFFFLPVYSLHIKEWFDLRWAISDQSPHRAAEGHMSATHNTENVELVFRENRMWALVIGMSVTLFAFTHCVAACFLFWHAALFFFVKA